MTEKRYYVKKYGDEFYILDSNTISEKEFEEKLDLQGYKAFEDSLTGKEVVDLLNENEELKDALNQRTEQCNKYYTKNEQLKQQLEDITLNWTQNHTNFDKDELYIKDNNTEITLKNNNLLISVCIPQIQEHFKFHYIVTGRRLEREYQYFKR